MFSFHSESFYFSWCPRMPSVPELPHECPSFCRAERNATTSTIPPCLNGVVHDVAKGFDISKRRIISAYRKYSKYRLHLVALRHSRKNMICNYSIHDFT